ncbi:hypothetical protein [Nocardioides lijunqiniae]|uniref:hypothetical protein n=1 Tax=Nocardioides lijunqiniae TaxID=2760832 RepID=UPI0018784D9E|nr:hypothetical protein [Nocardioides lijunqiniae]
MPPPLTRGPLPASVYWRRRLVVLSVAAVLVLAFARLLGGGSDGSSDDGAVTPAAAEQSSSAPSGTPSSTPRRTPRPTPTAPTTSAAPVLAEPEGRCEDSDIRVTPSVTGAVEGSDVVLSLDLRTLTAEACTWRVSPTSLTLRIRSGKDPIWSSAQCPKAIPVTDVVVRRAAGTVLPVTWKGQRSDEDCSRLAAWADPGFYLVAAAALGGEPTEVQFEMTKAVPPSTPSSQLSLAPTDRPSGRPAGGGNGGKPNKPDDDALPSGAVEPNGPAPR